MGRYRYPKPGERVQVGDGVMYKGTFLDGRYGTVDSLDQSRGYVWVLLDEPLPAAPRVQPKLLFTMESLIPIDPR